MHKFIVFTFLCSFIVTSGNGAPSRFSPLKKVIRISLAVSKATYLPIPGERFIQNGAIVENQSTISPRLFLGFILIGPKYNPEYDRIACTIKGWQAKVHQMEETEVGLFVHSQQRLAVFGLRGTEAFNFQDWKRNLNVFPSENYIDGRTFVTHKGFRNRYLNIAGWFEREYLKIPRNYSIIITGHSLGGAEATIAAVYAAGKLKRRPDAVVTFGSPLVGDDSFKTYYQKKVGCSRTLRIVAVGDLVAAVPNFFGYTHVCPELKVNGRTGFSVIKAHDLYIGYDRGLARKYSNDIDFGCNKRL